MRLRRYLLVALSCLLLLGLLTTASATGHARTAETPTSVAGTPAPFEGVTFERLADPYVPRASGGSLTLIRVRLDPGAAFPIEPMSTPGLAPTFLLVEEGTISLVIDSPLTVVRALGDGTPATIPRHAERVEAGTETELMAGDAALLPGLVSGVVRNEDAGEATLQLAVAVRYESATAPATFETWEATPAP